MTDVASADVESIGATTGDPTNGAADENIVREVIGVFDSERHLEAAVEQLGMAGIDRAAMSVLGAGARPADSPADRAATTPRSILSISDDPATPTAAFVSDISWSELRGMTTAVPLVIGGFGAAWAMAAAGGALILAIGATAASGAVGAGLGALLYHAVARRHEAAIREKLALGGLILWVRVADKTTEARALEAMGECGARLVHTHAIKRPWSVADSPLCGVQPDPFLEHDPSDGLA